MAETTTEVRADIEQTRARMSNAIDELERKIDVTQRIADHPWIAVGVAFGAGVALSATKADVQAAKVTADATAVVAPLVERAESFGIEQEKDIAAYALLEVAAAQLGHTSDAFLAWAQPILTNEDIAGSAKIPLVQCRLEREAKLDARAAQVLAMLRSMLGTH